jgi:hypothetical protein
LNNNAFNKVVEKDVFSWIQEATQDFEKIKEAMCLTLVLVTPSFTKTIIMECDALGDGIDVILMQ